MPEHRTTERQVNLDSDCITSMEADSGKCSSLVAEHAYYEAKRSTDLSLESLAQTPHVRMHTPPPAGSCSQHTAQHWVAVLLGRVGLFCRGWQGPPRGTGARGCFSGAGLLLQSGRHHTPESPASIHPDQPAYSSCMQESGPVSVGTPTAATVRSVPIISNRCLQAHK